MLGAGGSRVRTPSPLPLPAVPTVHGKQQREVPQKGGSERPQKTRSRSKQFAQFIIGAKEDGKHITYVSDKEKLADYFGKNAGAPHYLTLV
jgi:hypothetical protein